MNESLNLPSILKFSLMLEISLEYSFDSMAIEEQPNEDSITKESTKY